MRCPERPDGAPRAPRRHRPVRYGVVRAAGAVLVLLVLTAPPARAGNPAGAELGAAPTGQVDSSPQLSLVARSPWVDAEGEFDLDVATSGVDDTALVQVEVREAVDSVEDLERSLEDDVGRVVYRSARVALAFVPTLPDGTRRIPVTTSETRSDDATARLREPGVYPVVVTLEDDAGNVDTVRTPVVRIGTADDPLVAPRLHLLVDLAVPPTVGPEGRNQLTEGQLARLGRLASLLDGSASALAGAEPVPLTIAAHADTVDALTASTDPRAGQLLDALTDPSAGSRVDRNALGLPTVPLSAPALVETGLTAFLPALAADGRAALTDRLDTDLETTIWDADDGIDAPSARFLDRQGYEHVLVDGPDTDTSSPAAERSLVDLGPVPVAALEPLDAMLVDRTTTASLLARAADRVDAGHIALADLLVRDAGEGHEIVLRIDDAPDDSLLLRLLALAATPGSPVGIAPLGSPVDEAEGETAEVDLPESSTDLRGIADRVGAAAAAVDTFAGFVTGESARPGELRLRVATSLAAGIDDDRRTALLDSVMTSVDAAFGAVALAGQTDLNLTSRSGTLPLTIRNENPFPVRVVLQIRSDKLAFPEGVRFEYDLTEEVTRIDVPVRARATGSVPTFVELSTPDGARVLDSQRLDVRSTAISGVGIALSLGALAVLVVWWARTWRRNRRPDPGQSDG